MNILTKEECIELLKKYGLSERKIEHCVLVSKVAVFLAEKLIEKGENINLQLVEIGALLHDVGDAKAENHLLHAEVGTDILKKENIDERICNIVKSHLLVGILDDLLKTWEEKIVFYADKRVNSREVLIVTVEERTRRWPDIFPDIREEIIEGVKQTKVLEKEIFDIIGIEPDKLGEYID